MLVGKNQIVIALLASTVSLPFASGNCPENNGETKIFGTEPTSGCTVFFIFHAEKYTITGSSPMLELEPACQAAVDGGRAAVIDTLEKLEYINEHRCNGNSYVLGVKKLSGSYVNIFDGNSPAVYPTNSDTSAADGECILLNESSNGDGVIYGAFEGKPCDEGEDIGVCEVCTNFPNDWYTKEEYINQLLDPEPVNRGIFIDSGIMVSKDPLSRNTLIQQAIPYILASKYPNLLSDVSATLNETLVDCSYDGVKCDMQRDFSTKYNPNYGNCFTFNWNKKKVSSRAGEMHGLSMTITGSLDSSICSSTISGFRFQIHSQDIHSFPDTLGVFVPTNFETSMTITGNNFNLLSKPYGDCILDENESKDYYSGNYSVQGCIQSCLQSDVMSLCKCAFPMYASPNGTESCPIERMSCVEDVTKCTIARTQACSCPQPCQNTIFENSMSKIKIRENPLLLHICKKRGIAGQACLKTIGPGLAGINIYFSKMSLILYEEYPDYEITQVLSDIGGSMGMLLGASLITAVELLLLPAAVLLGI